MNAPATLPASAGELAHAAAAAEGLGALATLDTYMSTGLVGRLPVCPRLPAIAEEPS